MQDKINNHITLESLIFPSYEKIKEEIGKKVGLVPKRPQDLKKQWKDEIKKIKRGK